jgi:acetyltransferase-like isoleucine patch superfamily enzyme
VFKRIQKLVKNWIVSQVPEYKFYKSIQQEVSLGRHVKLYFPVRLYNVKIDNYSYIGQYSHLQNVEIGKFCSIGPKCFFGWGIHPTHGISTAPMFYSTIRQNGMTLSDENKVIEQKKIKIGNDVFIGMNVTILDGVTIGDGAVIGAGAVVSKDIPSYAIAIGNPIHILRYRFSNEIINALLEIKWWDLDDHDLKEIERNFFDVEKFVAKMRTKK